MSKIEKPNQEQVFKQKVSDDELEAVSGGKGGCYEQGAGRAPWWDDDIDNCTNNHSRQIYSGGFPNCAASVEDSSWCGNNDLCNISAVVYLCYNNSLTDEGCIIAAWD